MKTHLMAQHTMRTTWTRRGHTRGIQGDKEGISRGRRAGAERAAQRGHVMDTVVACSEGTAGAHRGHIEVYTGGTKG